MSLEQTTLPVGTLLRDRYLIKNIIGAGRSGTVYLVKDYQASAESTDLFALKEMLGLERQERYQFTFNGGLLQQLKHEALPVIYHIFNDNTRERVYLVMDYIEGIDLEMLSHDQPGERFNWLDLRGMLAPVFTALTYLHKQAYPIFHGDIKPINLVQQHPGGQVFLVDPGYAQAATSGQRGQFIPTSLSPYSAPEYLAGRVDASTDIYALAATLYQLLTGQQPVDAPRRLREVKRGEADPLLLASSLVPDLARPFARVIQQALSLDAGARFAQVEDFWQALNAVSSESESENGGRGKDEREMGNLTLLPPRPTVPLAGGAGSVNWSVVPVQEVNVASQVPPRRSARLLRLLALLLFTLGVFLLLGIGVWMFVGARTASPPDLQARLSPTVPATATATSTSGAYSSLAGTYQGTLNELNSPNQSFFMNIQQQGGHLSGTFSLSSQADTFQGTIDTAGNVQFTVFDTSGTAIYAFTGGLNGTTQSAETLGGTFAQCLPAAPTQCKAGAGGTWTLTQVTALVASDPVAGS